MAPRAERASRLALLRRLAAEPFVHFVLGGLLLFAAISLAHDLRRPTVRLDAREIEQTAAYWALQAGRPPNKEELAAIIRDRIDEELLAREAVRLGLDRDDMIVRRRLAQKMGFASEDLAPDAAPSETVLQAYYDRHREQFASPARVAMRHLFYSGDRSGVGASQAAREALPLLRNGGTPVGDPSLLPLTYADVSLDELARDYGGEFADAVRMAPLARWVGPVASAYGVHLIHVERRVGAVTPPLSEVRNQVLAAWRAEQREDRQRAYLDGLRRRYRVIVAGEAP